MQTEIMMSNRWYSSLTFPMQLAEETMHYCTLYSFFKRIAEGLGDPDLLTVFLALG